MTAIDLTERIHALVFSGITKASSIATDRHDGWLPLGERERFARAVVDELRRGNIEFRLGPLALLADADPVQAAADHHARLAPGTGWVCEGCGYHNNGGICTHCGRPAAGTEDRPAAAVHHMPYTNPGFTSCCGRTPFELSRDDRTTGDWSAVTCARRAEHQARLASGETT